MNHKRRLTSRQSLYLPNPKRHHLDSEGKHTENEDIPVKYTEEQTMLLKLLPHASPKLPPKERTVCMKELQPSALLDHDHSALYHYGVSKSGMSNNSLTCLSGSCGRVIGCGNDTKSASVLTSLHISEQNSAYGEITWAKKSDEELPEKSSPVEESQSFLKPNDVGFHTSLSRNKFKQPAIALMKMNYRAMKTSASSTSPRSYQVSPEVSNIILGGCMHRMASLNARACVAAFLQPERKVSPKTSVHYNGKRSIKSRVSDHSEEAELNPSITNKVVPVIEFEAIGLKLPACAVVLKGPDEHEDDGSQVSYNNLGLLYNGDTIYPHAHIFLTQSSNNELQLPHRILPIVVPSKLPTVKRTIKKAAATGVVQVSKKRAKVL